MLRAEVEKIFNEKKNLYMKFCSSSSNPICILLGGQPAAGKSYLTFIAEKDWGIKFLKVNGDEYRIYHPDHEKFIKNAKKYSEETQLFSNVFTEGFINEACNNKINIIVEGTMRTPDTTLNTANKFKNAGFLIYAYIIAAPAIVTELGIYERYQLECYSKGYGRLADIKIHNEAVAGLIKTVDMLYDNKSVDKISIYTFLAKEKIKEYTLFAGETWNCELRPSETIIATRNKQLNDKEFLHSCMERGENLIKSIPKNLRPYIQKILSTLT